MMRPALVKEGPIHWRLESRQWLHDALRGPEIGPKLSFPVAIHELHASQQIAPLTRRGKSSLNPVPVAEAAHKV